MLFVPEQNHDSRRPIFTFLAQKMTRDGIDFGKDGVEENGLSLNKDSPAVGIQVHTGRREPGGYYIPCSFFTFF
jgi:hypothetical protein